MLNSGDSFGASTITKLVSDEGHFSFVFEGSHPVHGESIAIKISKPTITDADDIQRFIHENEILHTLHTPDRHPHIIFPLSRIEHVPNLHYLMELANSRLDKFIVTNEETITFEDKINFFRKICLALGHAHNLGIAHRDLHWKNVLIKLEEEINEIKVGDFGRAKNINAPHTFSSLGAMGGINTIWPPEVFFAPVETLAMNHYIATDMFALGLLLFYILQGSPLEFQGKITASVDNFLRVNMVPELTGIGVIERKGYYKLWISEATHASQTPIKLTVSLPPEMANQETILNNVLSRLCNLDFDLRYSSTSDILRDMETI